MSILSEYNFKDLKFHHTKEERPREAYPAAHEVHEFYYFISGSGKYYVEGNAHLLTPGCVVLVRAGELHYVKISSGPYERMVVNFHPSILRGIDPEGLLNEPFTSRPLGQQNLYSPNIQNSSIRKYLDAMCRGGADIQTESARRLHILCNFSLILNELRRCFYSPPLQNHQKPSDTIGLVIAYINEHLTEPFGIKDITAHFYMDKSLLYREFRKSTGSTVWQYVIQKRLFLAKQLIREGASAAEAAEECGWKDYSSFFRQYTLQFGISPRKDK